MIFEKIRKKIEEKAFSVQLKQGIKEPSTFDAMEEKFSVREIKDIINQVEAEYNNGWIKCEGKTFAVGCKYLIVDKDNDIYIATYLNDNVFATRDKDYFMPIKLEATYCQLLPLPPQPPKGE